MGVPASRRLWYRSFYWRISITFVAFVVVFLIIQGIILRSPTPIQIPAEMRRDPVLAAEVAADVAETLGRGQTTTLSTHLKFQYPLPPADQLGWTVYVATRERMFSNTSGPLPPVVRLTAL
jgi:hypothetical protein